MRIEATKSNLAYLTLLALIAGVFLTFFLGDKLSGESRNLLTMLLTLLGALGKGAFDHYFDGVAKKPDHDDKNQPNP
jgi:hypothetical protein